MKKRYIESEQKRLKVDAFAEKVESELRKFGLSDQMSNAELEGAEGFRKLDFGAAPCALWIKSQRELAGTL